MYSFQPGIDVNTSMKKHNLTSRYSRYSKASSKPNKRSVHQGYSRYANYYPQDSTVTSRAYPPAVVTAAIRTNQQYSDVASNAATACTHLHSSNNILFSRPRVNSKWIWQQDPLPKRPQAISYASKMQSPYIRKLETYHGEHHRSIHQDYTAEELERINLKCKAWLESCTPWLP